MSKTNVIGKLIEPVISGLPSWHCKAVKFEKLDVLPVELPEYNEAYYIITCWDTNIYIRVHEDKSFDIIETMGPELTLDKEYLIIKPSY